MATSRVTNDDLVSNLRVTTETAPNRPSATDVSNNLSVVRAFLSVFGDLAMDRPRAHVSLDTEALATVMSDLAERCQGVEEAILAFDYPKG